MDIAMSWGWSLPTLFTNFSSSPFWVHLLCSSNGSVPWHQMSATCERAALSRGPVRAPQNAGMKLFSPPRTPLTMTNRGRAFAHQDTERNVTELEMITWHPLTICSQERGIFFFSFLPHFSSRLLTTGGGGWPWATPLAFFRSYSCVLFYPGQKKAISPLENSFPSAGGVGGGARSSVTKGKKEINRHSRVGEGKVLECLYHKPTPTWRGKCYRLILDTF